MDYDLAMHLIHATVQLEQAKDDGLRIVGTGFLVQSARSDGVTYTVLVTAKHVLEDMPRAEARIGYRVEGENGTWTNRPTPLTIRDAAGLALWTEHPQEDVATMTITAPPEFAKAAIPLRWLATDTTFADLNVDTGDEMMALGFPRGLSANTAGFPILRSGRVASYPISPPKAFPTFLLDFSVFPGNSGGPVFMATNSRRRPGAPDSQFIAGLLSKEVELNGERLGIGVVTHAMFIGETISLMQEPPF